MRTKNRIPQNHRQPNAQARAYDPSIGSAVLAFTLANRHATQLDDRIVTSVIMTLIAYGLMPHGQVPHDLFGVEMKAQLDTAFEDGCAADEYADESVTGNGPLWRLDKDFGALLTKRALANYFRGVQPGSAFAQVMARSALIALSAPFQQH